MNGVEEVTFGVSDVTGDNKPLPEVHRKEAVEALLRPGIPENQRQMAERLSARGFSIAMPECPPCRPVEACDRYSGRLVANVTYHPVVAAIHRAFMDHRPLRLSPDAVWLMIGQAVANHVHANAGDLRSRFVRHEGHTRIVVRRDDFAKGSPENPWGEVIGEFSAKVRDHVGPSVERFLPNFSTTGPSERVASEIVLLGAMRSYFAYVMHSMCGIPSITLEGTAGDWEALARHAEGFAEFGLEWWVGLLRPILRQFARAARGDVDTPFWRSLYKFNDQSGGPVITGWIVAFFPYLKDPRTGEPTLPVRPLLERGKGSIEETLYPDLRDHRPFASGPTLACLPGGLAQVPFLWEYRARRYSMDFVGGFVGVTQDHETLALRPEIGWAVLEAAEYPE